jgi:Microtubule associated protein (MAP65/ASE1 family).
VKQYYEENRDIFDLLEKRFELWRDLIDLEDKACDKER